MFVECVCVSNVHVCPRPPRRSLFSQASIVAPGRGILAADESTGTIGARFSKIGLENNEDNRRRYRELLFTTNPEVGKFISGAILYEETLFQLARDGVSMVDHMKRQNIIPGIKVRRGGDDEDSFIL